MSLASAQAHYDNATPPEWTAAEEDANEKAGAALLHAILRDAADTVGDYCHMLPDLSDEQRDAVTEAVSERLRTLAEPSAPAKPAAHEYTPRPFTSGDHCRFVNVHGVECAEHRDCDDYADGTLTEIRTGKRVTR